MTNTDWESDAEWLQTVQELRDYREAQLRAFEGVDDLLVARFVAGECSPEEVAAVNAAMTAQPAVRELVDVLREVAALEGFPDFPADTSSQTGIAEALRLALAFAADLQSTTPAGSKWLEFDAPLITALDRAAGTGSSDRLKLTERWLMENDRLFAVTAGDEDREPVLASLPWYTDLTDWPKGLDWDFVPNIPTWTVRIQCRAVTLRWTVESAGARMVFPSEVADQAPRGKDIAWEIYANDANGKPAAESLVRGVFRVLTPEQIEELEAELTSADRIEDPDRRNFVEFGYLVERKCFAEAISRLERMTADRGSLHLRLLRWRGLASIYLRMHRELTGQRRMGVPEGLWALQLSRENLRAAYGLLDLNFPEK